MEKICPRCGARFSCTGNDKIPCHCAEVELDDAQRNYIARKYSGCLCHACLCEIQEKVRPADIRDLSNFLLDFASSMLAAGVHTSRVERNVRRIAESFGYRTDMTIFTRHFTMSILHKDDDGIRRTSVRAIAPAAFNFEIISRLSSLSWQAHDNHLTLTELQESYVDIITTPRISRWKVLLLVSLANAAFCRLFGGDPTAMGLVCIATFAGFLLKQEMGLRKINHLAITILAAFTASMIASLGIWYDLGETPQIALGTSVLFLIPGVPLINSIIDILESHVLMGISRAVNALILVICIALGLSATLLILGRNVL